MENGSQQMTAPCTAAPAPFEEFKDSLGDTLNDNLTLAVVANSSAIADRLVAVILPLLATPDLAAVKAMPRVGFTTAENVEKFSLCTAVHEQDPVVSVIDMPNDCSFVVSLRGAEETKWSEMISGFLNGVAKKTWPRARQGEARPDKDSMPGRPHLKCAVQCSFQQLVEHSEGDTLVVLWSDRCPCCPGSLQCCDALMTAIEQTPAKKKLSVVCCNVDENDLDAKDWPSSAIEQIVPRITLYVEKNRNSEKNSLKSQVRFEGNRSCENVIKFLHANSSDPSVYDVDQILRIFETCCDDKKRARDESNPSASDLPASARRVEAQA